MDVLIYLCFTIFSILIQFAIIDILDITNAQAMYDQNNQSISSSTKYSNSTLQSVPYETSTKPVTILDIFYDTNIASTTEAATTLEETDFDFSTEYFNATEFSIFPNSSIFSTAKPGTIGTKKITNSSTCCCNLLYNICDINCCCDEDCEMEEKMLFHCMEQDINIQSLHSCYIKILNQTSHKPFIDHLLCAVKTNVPKKRNIVKYTEDMDTKVENVIRKSMIWQHNSKPKPTFDFNAQTYVYNDPIWIIQNETISAIDLPIPEINYYCSGKTPILYLRDLHYKCLIKIPDLEMFNIYQKLNSSHIISVVDKEDTKVKKNCSSLHCTPWKIIVCDKLCHSYNKTLDEPSCTEQICMNMVLKIEYIFHCNSSQITNGTVYLHKQTIPFKSMLVEQEIKVQFYLIRNNQKNIVKFSGNPGYLYGLPVIASYKESNFTDHFFQTNYELQNKIIYPTNIQGYCILTNLTYKVVKFGNNNQNKCRLLLQAIYFSSRNATENCQSIQKTIYDLLNINKPIYISPLGNPAKVKDNEWIELEFNIEKGFIYGELKDNSKLRCYNMVTKLQYVFTFVYFGKESGEKILDAKAIFQMQDLSILIDDLAMVLTVETAFLDITKPPVYEYAKGLGLNIHLPEDFFLPFTSVAHFNRNTISYQLLIMVYYAQLSILE